MGTFEFSIKMHEFWGQKTTNQSPTMQQFIVQHIDAFITILVAIALTWSGYRAAARGDLSRRTELLKTLGPLVLVFGLFRMFFDTSPPLEWRRVYTDDEVASAEFPGPPKTNDQNQTIQGQSIRTVGWVYQVPGKDISLRLSYSDSAPAEAEVPAVVKFEASKQFFIDQGFRVAAEEAGNLGSDQAFSLHLEKVDQKAAMWLRAVYQGNRIYRAIGAAGDGFHEDPLIRQFMESFQVRGVRFPAMAR